MRTRISVGILGLFCVGKTLAFSANIPSIPPDPPGVHLQTLDGASDFDHATGRAGSHGWALDYKRDRSGYPLSRMYEPMMLEPGLYRANFILRRGNYPNKGLLHHAYVLFRLEIWDLTRQELIAKREIQIGDFSAPNRYESKWIEFSMKGREGDAIEPRVFWLGLANGEVEKIQIMRFPDISLRTLEEKALRIGNQLENEHLENGFVVSRKANGEPDETGDATTYTGFYVASLAWKYAVTKDQMTYQALENGLGTLHKAVKGTDDSPLIMRFVDKDGLPFPKPPSKDVYTSFVLAYSMAAPYIENKALKEQMELDLERIGTRFLQDDLNVRAGSQVFVSLTPYFMEEEIRDGIRKLLKDKKRQKSLLKTLNDARSYFPFYELWPGMKQVIRALEQGSEEKLIAQVIPTINGLIIILERVRSILREQYRDDLFLLSPKNFDYPGKRLMDLITVSLAKLPNPGQGQRIELLSDLRILASNSVISLHIIRTALTITQKPQFEDYYRTNLHTQDALLKTAVDWYGVEDDLTKLAAGNVIADRERRGYLGALALFNLYELEKNPSIKESYKELLGREWTNYRHDDNPLFDALNIAAGNEVDDGIILRDLDLYPEDTTGFGEDYWKENGKLIAEKWGAGEYKGYSREPLPISHRPKDSFLWQRNARRLKGDHLNTYPGTDYLFLYWFCRAHKIIPPTPAEPTAKER